MDKFYRQKFHGNCAVFMVQGILWPSAAKSIRVPLTVTSRRHMCDDPRCFPVSGSKGIALCIMDKSRPEQAARETSLYNPNSQRCIIHFKGCILYLSTFRGRAAWSDNGVRHKTLNLTTIVARLLDAYFSVGKITVKRGIESPNVDATRMG